MSRGSRTFQKPKGWHIWTAIRQVETSNSWHRRHETRKVETLSNESPISKSENSEKSKSWTLNHTYRKVKNSCWLFDVSCFWVSRLFEIGGHFFTFRLFDSSTFRNSLLRFQLIGFSTFRIASVAGLKSRTSHRQGSTGSGPPEQIWNIPRAWKPWFCWLLH